MDLYNSISALKNNNRQVFDGIFHQYYQKVYFYVLSKTHSSFIAEETTQITFIKLWNYRHSLNDSLPIERQVFRIAKTTCIDQLRMESKRSQLSSNVRLDRSHNNVIDFLKDKELEAKLQSLVNQMPPMRKTVFKLSRFESKSNKEIAQILSLSVRTVESHISVALKQLANFFHPFFLILIFFGLN